MHNKSQLFKNINFTPILVFPTDYINSHVLVKITASKITPWRLRLLNIYLS